MSSAAQDRCACGSALVSCQGCAESRCLTCDPYTDYERLNRCCVSTSPVAGEPGGAPTSPGSSAAKLPELSDAHREALQRIVSDWIGEGFTTPPYTSEQYDIFEWLGLANNYPHSYDTRRPA